MIKSQLILIFSCLLSFCGCNKKQSAGSENENHSPNIVLIFTDDQGYRDLGCFGAPDILTPNIDRMAREGARFNNFHVAQAVCSASRSALMTGCYPNRVGVSGAYGPNSPRGLHPEETTIAEMLKTKGYATAIYGKWHLGDHPEMLPTKQGFDEYFGIPYSNDMWPHHPWQGTVFDFPELPLMENELVVDTLDEQSQITTWYTEHAVDFIERNREEPFFLYLAHSMPHVPLFVSEKFKGKSPRGLYGDVIMEIDWSVGQVLQTLEDNGLTDNTLVIFTSDNGPWLSYGTHSGSALPLREGKGTSLEGGVRVPCVMKWPGHITPGTEIDAPAMTIDILPTLAEIAAAELPERKIDGKSILELMTTGMESSPHQEAYFIYYHNNHLEGMLSGDGRWKMYFPHQYRSLNGRTGRNDGLPIDYEQLPMGEELYDLYNDISETTNVAAKHPDIIEKMKMQAEGIREELGDELTDREGKANRPVGYFPGEEESL